MERPDSTRPTLDEEGIPDLEGPLPGKAATGDPQEGVAPPSDPPASEDWGVTDREQRAGEPLDVRLAREQPDVGELGAEADAAGASALVQDADEAPGVRDDEKDAVAREADQSGLGVGPEAAAVREVEEPDAG